MTTLLESLLSRNVGDPLLERGIDVAQQRKALRGLPTGDDGSMLVGFSVRQDRLTLANSRESPIIGALA